MKPYLYVIFGIILCTPHAAFAARFSYAKHGPEEHYVFGRCKLEDNLNTSAEAVARVNWARECDMVPKNKIHTMLSEPNDDGILVTREWASYPTFSHNRPGFPLWIPNLANCDIPSDVFWSSVCRSGCYQADQLIRFSTGDVEISEALQIEGRDIVTLASDATLEEPRYDTTPVDYYTMDLVPQTQTIVSLYTESGGSLKVTNNHPVVRGDGVMVAASTLGVGDDLVKENGTADKIVRIEANELYTQVYNVAPKSCNLTSNIVVAQGFLNGSSKYQNEYDRYLNSMMLRSSIPAEILP